ncbi:MAG: sigma 54-interacting transcriptional regulator [candidate division Zixibacteria bacterium]|nr:sigma 54-interacting transcriptional regulator [candidate division Zixibacteria bacterium]
MKTKTHKIRILDQASRLLRQNSHAAALELLNRPVADDGDLLTRGEWCLLKGECLLFMGNYDHDYPEQANRIFRKTSEHGLFARAKYLKGWQHQGRGENREAKEALLEAYTSFLRVDDFSLAARTLNRLASLCVLCGDIEQAIDNLVKCIEYHRKAGNTDKVRVCENNLALIYRKTGRIKESLALYADGQNDYEQLDKRNRGVFKLGYAVSRALSGDTRQARKLLEQAYELVNDYQRETAIYYEYLGWVLLLEEKYEAADKALQRSLKIAHAIAVGSDHDSQVKRLLADLSLARGDFSRAEEYATEALAIAEKINEQVEIAACYRVLARVAYQNGNNCQAREWFKKAVNLFSHLSSRYEMALTRYQAALCGLYTNSERTAYLYLAREYFEAEGIESYVRAIDQALESIEKTAPENKPSPVQHRLPADGECPVIIAANYKMKKVLEFARHVARSEMNILLTGATGTGKDLMARYIHYHSGRKGKLITLNAAAIPNSMVEAELFGYARGAFTGAEFEKPGIFEVVDGGTFYLNEIADATPEFQAKLLEILETRCVRRLGENITRPVNFRLIAATNHDLNERIKNNLFRLDLFHRLNEIPIDLPPLDKRTDDIPALVEYFLLNLGKDVRENGNRREIERLGALMGHRSWPGNVRHLWHEVNRLWLASQFNLERMLVLAEENLPRSEREELLTMLRATGWNRREAARRLGVSEATVRYRMRKYNIYEENE